ncbi:unnamed protein product [Lactuca virosa]|uniref:F-box domain-containing protein n=1 Tax=Lactuca virosa TaxID=75947 RepID=A0AAU9LRN9_9ASTR|nr:unnamed protein product [Lactuca virosa]
MVKDRSKTRKQNCDTSTSTLTDNCDLRPWSDLSHDVLYLVTIKLGVVDCISFSGVCKSWRSFTLFKKKKFMASKPRMLIWISAYAHEKNYCYLADVEERVFRTSLPHFRGRTCVRSTCGYLIILWKETKDLCLVNPITRHQIHFHNVYFCVDANCKIGVRAILVFSPTIFG